MRSRRILDRIMGVVEDEPLGIAVMAVFGLVVFGLAVIAGSVLAGMVWWAKPWSFLLLPLVGLWIGTRFY